MAERDREALIAAIRAEPDDNLPRLALADWLDEHGGDGERAWARLIRVQCEHARRGELLTETGATEGVLRLNRESQRILREHRKTLFSGLPRGRGFALFYSRGMPEYIMAVTGRDFLRRAEQAFAAASIHTVRITQINPDDMDALAVSGWLTRLRGLELMSWEDDAAMADIVRTLGLADVSGMRSLEIYHSPVGSVNPDGILAALAAGRRWTALRWLVLYGGGAAWSGAIRDLGQAMPLRELTLGPNLTPEAVGALATNFPALRSLKFPGSSLTNESADTLAGTKQLAHLRHLDLTDGITPLTDPSVLVRLLTSPALADLASVRLCGRNQPVGDFSAVRPRKAVRPPTLRVLQMLCVAMKAADVTALVRLSSLRGLTSLDLTGNPIGSEGAAALAGTSWERLARLDLASCGIDNSGVAALAASPRLAGLVHLNLHDNPIGVDATRAIARSPHLAGLRHLALPPRAVKGEAAKELMRRFGRKGWSGTVFTRPE